MQFSYLEWFFWFLNHFVKWFEWKQFVFKCLSLWKFYCWKLMENVVEKTVMENETVVDQEEGIYGGKRFLRQQSKVKQEKLGKTKRKSGKLQRNSRIIPPIVIQVLYLIIKDHLNPLQTTWHRANIHNTKHLDWIETKNFSTCEIFSNWKSKNAKNQRNFRCNE